MKMYINYLRAIFAIILAKTTTPYSQKFRSVAYKKTGYYVILFKVNYLTGTHNYTINTGAHVRYQDDLSYTSYSYQVNSLEFGN